MIWVFGIVIVVLFSYNYITARKAYNLQKILTKQIKDNSDYFKTLVEKTVEIENKEQQVLDANRVLLNIQAEIKKENRQIQRDKKSFQKIVASNEAILNANEMYLFNIKESMLNTIKDYRKASKLISQVISDETKYEELYDLLLKFQLKTGDLEDNFMFNFKMTSQQYADNKGKINNTDFSIN